MACHEPLSDRLSPEMNMLATLSLRRRGSCVTAACLPLVLLPACGFFGDVGWSDSLDAAGSLATSSSATSGSATGGSEASSGNVASVTTSGGELNTTTSDGGTSMSATDTATTAELDLTTAGGSRHDLGVDETTSSPVEGCSKIDVLFVIDGSISMYKERQALAIADEFTGVVDVLAGLGGGIDYRIGVSTDNDHQFITPMCWQEPNKWISSDGHTSAEVAAAFECAMSGFGQDILAAPAGCEHALTSAVDMLDPDINGFVRDNSLLVLVFIADVDDYGDYDQPGGNTCGMGCPTPPSPLEEIYERLVDVKGGNASGIAALVIAGDPSKDGGTDACGRPGSCGCDTFDCDVFHATRLYEFAGLLASHGGQYDICEGASSITGALKNGLMDVVGAACMEFDPNG